MNLARRNETEQIVTSEEIVVSEICDCLWSRNKRPNKADWIVTHDTTTMYMIVCTPHKEMFEEENVTNQPITFHPYTLELNEQLAEKVKKHLNNF